MKLEFGKHKGKTVADLIAEDEFSYVVWLAENVANFTVSEKDYEYCKNQLRAERIIQEAIMESDHGDWGDRD